MPLEFGQVTLHGRLRRNSAGRYNFVGGYNSAWGIQFCINGYNSALGDTVLLGGIQFCIGGYNSREKVSNRGARIQVYNSNGYNRWPFQASQMKRGIQD